MLPTPVPLALAIGQPVLVPVAATEVVLAVIIPAFRQPGLLAEAIAAVLGQRGAPPTGVVVVDDGCPFPETAATALDLAAAHPGRVFVLRRRNGGLSAARNTGIDFALAAFPACRGLFFLDADNRLHPPFLARAAAALRAAPAEVGWFYPDFDEFGGNANWTATGDFMRLPLLLQNYCEAGSLVRREVFEAGLRFDETLRHGFEDWDFWLQASTAGFAGQHLPDAGFRYRRRPESMLAAAERQRGALVSALHRKHAAALKPQALLALEAAEAPRYAVHAPDRPGPRWLLDPACDAGADLPAPVARERFLVAAAAPAACFHPPVMVFADGAALGLLRRLGLVRGLFWRAEVMLRDAVAVGLDLVQGGDDELRVEVAMDAQPDTAPLAGAAMILVASRALASWLEADAAEAAPGTAADWLQAAAHPTAGQEWRPAVRRLLVTLPRDSEGIARIPLGRPVDPMPDFAPDLPPPAGATGQDGTRPRAVGDAGDATGGPDRPVPGRRDESAPLRLLLLEAAMLRAAGLARGHRPAGWREDFRQRRDDAASRAQALSGLGVVLPCPPLPGRRSFGFVLPVFAFGGVERVVTAQARCLRERGWLTHLVVLGAGRASLPEAARDAFDDVVLAAGLGEAAADAAGYLGAEISGFGTRPAATSQRDAPGAADALGLLGGMDAVLNTHSLGAHALMARLRACGVRTYCGLHLVERGGFGNPLGTPHTALAYEHAYDGFTVISDQLRDWCVAQGMPAAKLHLVRNAPGYLADAGTIAAIRAARAGRPAGPLRALFLGRLDAQKGLDRLAAVIARTRDRVAWRVAGQAVLEVAPGSAEAALGVAVEPPARTAAALDALYGWADVVVLPSRFEGVPLTLLEAQRLGCAVVATAVGAVAEIVADGMDGILVPAGLDEPRLVDALVAALAGLDRDRDRLAAIGAAAAARLEGAGWAATMRDFLAHLDAACPAPAAARCRP